MMDLKLLHGPRLAQPLARHGEATTSVDGGRIHCWSEGIKNEELCAMSATAPNNFLLV